MVVEHSFSCPYCFQVISFLVDTSEAESRFIEDCEVCCNPIEVVVQSSSGRITAFEAEKAQ